MTQNLTSIGKIISKLYRDLRLNDPQFELDAIEWVGEAVSHIGTGVSFEKRSEILEVEDYVSELPSNLFRLQEVFLMKDAKGPDDDEAERVPLPSSNSNAFPTLNGGTAGFPD